MLQLRAFGASAVLTEVASRLEATPGARHVILTAGEESNSAVLTADLVDEAVDHAVQELRRTGLPEDDVMLLRLDSIGPSVAQRPLASVVWADLLSQAGANAKPLARYLVLMAAAGMIAGFGVIYANSTLIVGAMAISPDLLPICAAATALVLTRWGLALRAGLTLVAGLGCAAVVAGVMTFVLHSLHVVSGEVLPAEKTFLQGLVSVNVSTPLVAFAAGIAGMLALETRSSSAVGVAISVTTIPASAYLGVAAGVGDARKAVAALGVLGINVAMLLIGGSLTLITQRALKRREGHRATSSGASDEIAHTTT